MFVACASQKAEAVEVDFTSGSDAQSKAVLADDGKCEDELTEYDRLLGITSASDEDKASALVKREEAISKRINADLSNNFGNLVQRICLFISKNCNSIITH